MQYRLKSLGDSFVSPESVNSVASVFELLPASDGDAIRISTTVYRVFHRPSRRWASQVSRARTPIPSRQAVPISRVCMHPTSTCQHDVAIDHGKACIIPRSGATRVRVFQMLQSGATRVCDPAQRGAGMPASGFTRTDAVIA